MPPTPEAADLEMSQGAREERAAFRAYLERQRGLAQGEEARLYLEVALDWVAARQRRYDLNPGGVERQ